MTKPNTTEIIAIIDRSGSMQTIADDMRGGFDAFVQSQRALPGSCTLTLVQFSNIVKTVYTAKPIAEVPPLDLVPSGMTALYDAMGETINAVGLRLATLEEGQRPAKVLVVIVTDGKENASREYKRIQIEAMIKIQTERYAWEFAYLGANQDAFAVASEIGVKPENVATYEPTEAGARAAMAVLDASVTRSRCGGAMSIGQDAYDAELGRVRGGRS